MVIMTGETAYENHFSINVETFVSKFVDQIKAVSGNLKHSKFSKHLKPYWDNSLTHLSKESKKARWDWVKAGRPRDSGDPIVIRYKEAKRTFMREQRLKSYAYEIECIKKLNESNEVDQKYFWYMINKRKRGVNKVQPIQNDAGLLITDVDELRNEWNAYYNRLYTWGENEKYDESHRVLIENEVEEYAGREINELTMQGGPIAVQEIKREISKMKNKKAPGWDNLTAEHLKYFGKLSTHILAWLMNLMVAKENIPQHYKRGLICPIPKAGKDPTHKDNNRGITLLTVMYKLFERIMLAREKDWLARKDTIDDLQGAGQDKCSSLHTSMLLQEIISHNRSRGATVYVTFLDIRKAFDTVWIEGLLHKLYKSGMSNKIWRLVREGYRNFECSAYVAGRPGGWFIPQRGVHQGAPLSMKLYQVYLNDLLQQLRESIFGARLNAIDGTCPSFADDTTIVALYKHAMNKLLELAFNHKTKWGYEFNTDKTVAMVWGGGYKSEYEHTIGKWWNKGCHVMQTRGGCSGEQKCRLIQCIPRQSGCRQKNSLFR